MEKKSSCLEGYDFSTDRKLFFSLLFDSVLEKASVIVYNKLVREIYPKWSEKDRKRGQQGGNRFE